MFNIKYLEYFTISADMGSFSKAAAVLYTTQSHISKGVKILEEYVGDQLLIRQVKGLVLTPQGKHVYKYASRIIEDMGALKNDAKSNGEEWVYISTNPSSWVADRFVQFYDLHSGEDVHWRVLTASMEDIMSRVADHKDELGFVYVLESQKVIFEYMLSRAHLEFTPLARTSPRIFVGKGHPYFGAKTLTEEQIHHLRFVQGYQDVFGQHDDPERGNANGKELARRDIAVVTNSDYIMERLLLQSKVANIGADYLTDDEHRIVAESISLGQGDDVIVFGYLKRKKEKPGKWAEEFINHIQNALKGKD